MGACFDHVIIENRNFDRVRKSFKSLAESSRRRSGDEYSGQIGMVHDCINQNKKFTSINEALDYLNDNHEKWEDAWAVEAVDGKETEASKKKREKLIAELSKAKANLANLTNKIRDEIKNAKSAFRGCKKCKSKVNKDYVRDAHCPVCGESLYSDTHKNRIAGMKKKYEQAQKNVDTYKGKYSKGKTVWVVGGWFSY